jgi:hypothetical protein
MKNRRYEEDGLVIWYFNREMHRVGGPAVGWADAGMERWMRGKQHREDKSNVEISSDAKS